MRYAKKNILVGIGRVDNDGILGLVVDHQIGVVVTTAHPWKEQTLSRVLMDMTWTSLHMGIDWICMAREKASCRDWTSA